MKQKQAHVAKIETTHGGSPVKEKQDNESCCDKSSSESSCSCAKYVVSLRFLLWWGLPELLCCRRLRVVIVFNT